MEIRGARGTLVEFTPTQALLRQEDERLVAIPNQSILEGVVVQ